ncbi:hypothetical protein Droror1_Dr00008303 [Drosera rotundifolia]
MQFGFDLKYYKKMIINGARKYTPRPLLLGSSMVPPSQLLCSLYTRMIMLAKHVKPDFQACVPKLVVCIRVVRHICLSCMTNKYPALFPSKMLDSQKQQEFGHVISGRYYML